MILAGCKIVETRCKRLIFGSFEPKRAVFWAGGPAEASRNQPLAAIIHDSQYSLAETGMDGGQDSTTDGRG